MTTHEWRERNEDGEVVIYRAKHHAGRWNFQYRPKSEPNWKRYRDEDVPLDVLQSFRTILWNKVQRRRCPEKLIGQIDAIIESKEQKQREEE